LYCGEASQSKYNLHDPHDGAGVRVVLRWALFERRKGLQFF
jgi:hypothetical protein